MLVHAEGVSDYTGADAYTLANSDYPQGKLMPLGFIQMKILQLI